MDVGGWGGYRCMLRMVGCYLPAPTRFPAADAAAVRMGVGGFPLRTSGCCCCCDDEAADVAVSPAAPRCFCCLGTTRIPAEH